jgi:hypothetical protein
VPLTVWPAIPEPGPCPASQPPVPCPHRWQPTGAAALIGALSKPGDLIVVPSLGTGTFLTAAAATGRHAVGMTAAPGHHDSLSALLDRSLSPRQRQLARLEPGGPAALLTGSSPHAGQAALVIATACPTPGCPAPAPEPSADAGGTGGGEEQLHAACQRALAPRGLLVVVTRAARHAGYPGDLIARSRHRAHLHPAHHRHARPHCRLPPCRCRHEPAARAVPARRNRPGPPPDRSHRLAGLHPRRCPTANLPCTRRSTLPGSGRPPAVSGTDLELRLSVWPTAQRDARTQRRGRELLLVRRSSQSAMPAASRNP